ncbi:MAG: hypothetical protein AB7O66_12635 [Limisphaerales bacterium]
MPAAAPTTPRPGRVPLPTSFGGVAAVSERHGFWLLGWQILFAVATTLVAVWTFEVAWGRAIQRAISALPDDGRIEGGRLEWPEPKPRILHQGPFIAFVVDPVGLRETGLATDVTVSLETDRLAVRSFLGWSSIAYPPGLELPLTRVGMTGAVATWRTPFFLAFGLASFASLLVSWTLLSLAYGLIVWVAAAVLGRPIGFRTARRLAAASLLPASVLMAAAIALYATRQLGLEALLIAWPLHIVLGWVYCAGAWTRLRREAPDDASPGTNPFATASLRDLKGGSPAGGNPSNPFQTPG